MKVRTPHGRVHVNDHPGDEPAVVLMHGFPDDSRIYHRLAPRLSPRRVVTFDFVGYGRSDRVGASALAVADRQEELDAVVDALGLEDITVVGHDASGPVAIDYALAEPRKVGHVVLLNTFYGRAPMLRLPEMIGLFADEQLAALADAMVADPGQRLWLLQHTARRFGSEDLDPDGIETTSIIPQFFGDADQPDALAAVRAWTRALSARLDQQDRRITTGVLAAVDSPVTLLFGEHDEYLSPALARHLAQLFQRAEVRVLDGASHWPQWDQPDITARLIMELTAGTADSTGATASAASGDGFEERWAIRGGDRLHVREQHGEEPAIVLMHGFPDNHHLYDLLVPHLAGRHVVVFDFLGWGASDKPSDHAYTFANQIGDLDAVVTGLGLERVVLVPHDASGPAAINWALDHQDQVAAIVALNTFYGLTPDSPPNPPEAIRLFSDPAYERLARHLTESPTQFRWLYDFQVGGFIQTAAVRAEFVPLLYRQFDDQPSTLGPFVNLNTDLNAAVLANTERHAELRSFTPPVRFAFGEHDPYLSPAYAQALAELFPQAEATTIPGAGHFPQLDAPALVARANPHHPHRASPIIDRAVSSSVCGWLQVRMRS